MKSFSVIEDDFLQETELLIQENLGSNLLESEKDELINFLLDIFRQRSQKILKRWQDETSLNANNMYNQPINIIINGTSGSYIPTNFSYSQSPSNQIIGPNQFPYLTNYTPYQFPITHPFPQQTNISYFNPLLQLPIIPGKNIKKGGKKKSKKDKKSKKKQTNPHDKRKEKNSSTKNSSQTEKTEEKEEQTILKFEIPPPGCNNGIIKYLTDKTGGNIHDNRTIEVTTNSLNNASSSNHPKNLLDDKPNNRYLSSCSKTDIWICFDFKNMQVELSGYMIKIRSINDLIRNWDIEISDDKRNWTSIDNHNNSDELSSSTSVKFTCQSSKFSRYIRFHTIKGTNYGFSLFDRNHYVIRIDSIEFYGRLKTSIK